MLCGQIVSSDYPTLSLNNDVRAAGALFEKSQHSEIPILEEEKLVGILSFDSLAEFSLDTKLADIENRMTRIFVLYDGYFLSALKLMSISEKKIIPVLTKDGDYCGVITRDSILKTLETFLDVKHGTGGLIVLQMDKINYSFAEISKLVESNDTEIVQLNTYVDPVSQAFTVAIRVGRTDISDIVSTLQRYDYHVAYYFGEELYENELKRNYEALMNYLNI